VLDEGEEAGLKISVEEILSLAVLRVES